MNLMVVLYVVVLLVHAGYAAFVIRRRLFSLETGAAQSPAAILFGLILLNGISMVVFFWPVRWLVLTNVIFHVVLFLDELRRLRRVPARWPFAVNHLLFAGLLTSLYR